MTQPVKIIDGDGHVFEDHEAIAKHFPYGMEVGRLERGGGLFPSRSHIQFSLTRRPPGAFGIGSDGRFRNRGIGQSSAARSAAVGRRQTKSAGAARRPRRTP